jgi:hypothetical protein
MTTMNAKTENDIAKFFHGRDAALKLFNLLRKLIEKNCSPNIEVTKTQISFGENYKYIWIWLPQTWIAKRTADSITLTIMTGEKLKNDRIEESVQPKKGYWTHHIIIESKKDIDKEVEELIKASYNFYLKRLANKLGQTKTKASM